jgi:lactate permease
VAANYISVPLADIIAALAAAAAVVLLLRVWSPSETMHAPEPEKTTGGGSPPAGTGGGHDKDHDEAGRRAGGVTVKHDPGPEVAKAYAPYLVIIAIFSVANITAIKEFLLEEPFTYVFAWPGLEVLNTAGDPVTSTMYSFNWLPAAGTLMIFAGIITALILKISPARMAKAYVGTYVELKSAIITVMAVLALAYVMNLSGQTTSLGAWLAGAGGAFALLSPILGWIGVAVTGSDTSANALFGALQVQTATQAGLDPLLMAAANSSGGVLGKMVSPQNLAIAAAAVGLAGREGEIFRKVLGWSLVLLVLMCIIVGLQATPVLSWMVP